MLPHYPMKLLRKYVDTYFGFTAPQESGEDEYGYCLVYYSGKDGKRIESFFLPDSEGIFQQSESPFGQRTLLLTSSTLFPEIAHRIEMSSRLPVRKWMDETGELSPVAFKLDDKVWSGNTPRIMAVLNVTQDSFYDGGKYYGRTDYDVVAQKLIEEGADIIDIGGESTRPGADAINEQEEMQRVIPVIRQIRSRFSIPISIDTQKPNVANAGLESGANLVNDVSGLSHGIKMLEVVIRHKAAYCLTHTQGIPKNMQNNPQYFDVIGEVVHFFREKLRLCETSGLPKEKILLDAGIGFGKTVEHNLDLLRFLRAFKRLGCQLLLGTSNKSFIGHILNRATEERLPGSIATQVLGLSQGANVFRVHNVRPIYDALHIAAHYF